MFIRKIPNVKWNVIQAFFCTSTRHGNSCFLRKLTALPIKKIPTTTQRAHKKKKKKNALVERCGKLREGSRECVTVSNHQPSDDNVPVRARVCLQLGTRS